MAEIPFGRGDQSGRDEYDDVDVTLRAVKVRICQACLDGVGNMCRTPGCFLIWHEVLLGWDPLEYEIVNEEPGNENT